MGLFIWVSFKVFAPSQFFSITVDILAVVLFQPVDIKGKQNSFSVVFCNSYFSLNHLFVLSA